MDKSNYRLTPSGYAVLRKEDVLDGEVDLEIEKLFNLYNRIATEVNLKDLRLQTLQHAFDYFSPFNGFENWVTFNIKEVPLTGLQARFLEDTLKFIQTGRRDIGITGWEYLLRQDNEGSSANAENIIIKSKEAKVSKLAYPYTFKNKGSNYHDTSLGRWLSHPYGFQDMIWSLKILFATKLD